MRTKIIFLLTSALLLLVSCTAEIDQTANSSWDNGLDAEFYATIEAAGNPDTKVYADENLKVLWNADDRIAIFNKSTLGVQYRFAGEDGATAGSFKKIATDEFVTGNPIDAVYAAYPYDELISISNSGVISLTLPSSQSYKENSFGIGANSMISATENNYLSFKNLGSYLSFKFYGNGVSVNSITLKGNNHEKLAGAATVTMAPGGTPSITMDNSATESITLTCSTPVALNASSDNFTEFWFVLPPTTFTKGFTVTVKDAKGGIFEKSTSGALTLARNNLRRMSVMEVKPEYSTGQEGPNGTEGGTESGLYLGMSTFERYLTYYPTHLISEETLESYNDIVDNLELTTLNGTALYYSIDEDITTMQSITLPDDLFNVSIVTFTDGLDEGSLSYRRGVYKTKSEYLDALHTRLTNEQVSGLPIKSYAIGLKGTDAQSNLTEFRNNLEKIASTPENANEQYVYEISSINELNSSFESIADQLSQNIRVQKVIVSIPYPEDGERKRFTLDNKAPAQSTKYIEGVVDIDNLQLTNVVYYGLTSTSGSVVPISADNWFDLEFTFEGIQTLDGTEIVQDNIQLWYIPASGSSWQRNTEFSPSENSSVYTEKKSALVLLNLDLSKSLEGQLPTLKTGVKSFLSKLYAASVDPNVVKTVRLNKTELNLKVGQSETLQANVSPSTAPLSSLHWTSSIPSVATVDQNGRVTGVSEGTTIISVYSENGKELATCTTIVSFQHVESISLNITEKTLYVGKTVTLVATVYPSYASDKSVVWTSSNALVASVNSTGKVTGVANGTATITATTTDGGRSATCTIVVAGDPPCSPSSTPIDLSLAVIIKETGDLGYITQSELQYADMSEYDPLGLTILSESENFIIAMEDASSEPIDRGEVELYKNTPNFYYDITEFYNLPTYNQGVIISSRWDEINNALQQIGGESFKRYTWTKSYKASNNSLSLYAIAGSGGSLYSPWSYDDVYVREVIPLENAALNCFITKTKGIYFSYLNNSQRCFVNALSDVPPGCSVDGVAVSSSTGKGNVVISLADASSSPMTWSGATTSFGSTNLPSKDQALLISARLSEINTALEESGGNKLITFNNNYYWTNADRIKNSTRYYYYLNQGGFKLDYDSGSETHYVRLVKGTFSNNQEIY